MKIWELLILMIFMISGDEQLGTWWLLILILNQFRKEQ